MTDDTKPDDAKPDIAAPLTPADVRRLADCAGLPLAPGREAVIVATLAAWLADANALSRQMAAAEHRDLVPATVFAHPLDTDGDREER